MSKKIIFTDGLIDLAQPRLGSKVIFKTDDFFASAKRIIDPLPAVFKEGLFDKNGKWMDGWESRRKRIPGHDYLIIKLGKPGSISKVDVDTSHFNGNQPSMISLEACYSKSKPLSLLLLVSQPSPIFFALPGAKIFSAFPKCSLLQATTEAPFKSEVKLTVLLPKLLFSLEMLP